MRARLVTQVMLMVSLSGLVGMMAYGAPVSGLARVLSLAGKTGAKSASTFSKQLASYAAKQSDEAVKASLKATFNKLADAIAKNDTLSPRLSVAEAKSEIIASMKDEKCGIARCHFLLEQAGLVDDAAKAAKSASKAGDSDAVVKKIVEICE